MKNLYKIIIGVIAIGIAVFAGLRGRNMYMSSIEYVSIPVPVSQIEPYTTINESLIKMVEYPSALSENGSYALSMEDLVGKVSTSVLAPGLPVAKTLLSTQDEYRMGNAEDEILSIPISPEMAVGGQIRIGENINIYRIVVDKEKDVLTQIPETGAVYPLEDDENIQNISDLDTVKVELVASVPVLEILDSTGESLTRAEPQDNSIYIAGNTASSESDAPAAILMVSVPPEKVDTILRLIGLSEKGGELMWVTLASVSDHATALSTE